LLRAPFVFQVLKLNSWFDAPLGELPPTVMELSFRCGIYNYPLGPLPPTVTKLVLGER
jgi:hypothetical protein